VRFFKDKYVSLSPLLFPFSLWLNTNLNHKFFITKISYLNIKQGKAIKHATCQTHLSSSRAGGNKFRRLSSRLERRISKFSSELSDIRCHLHVNETGASLQRFLQPYTRGCTHTADYEARMRPSDPLKFSSGETRANLQSADCEFQCGKTRRENTHMQNILLILVCFARNFV